MSTLAGVVRSADGLAECADVLDTVASELPERPEAADVAELRNLVEVGRVLVAAALARTESRGTQARLDFPDTDPAQMQFEMHGLILALHYEARFLRSPDSVRRALQAFEGIVERYSHAPGDAPARDERLGEAADLVAGHRSRRTVVHAGG